MMFSTPSLSAPNLTEQAAPLPFLVSGAWKFVYVTVRSHLAAVGVAASPPSEAAPPLDHGVLLLPHADQGSGPGRASPRLP